MPSVVLENDRPEMLFLANSMRYARAFGTIAAGGAGTFASTTLYNPLNSSTLAVLEEYTTSPATGQWVVCSQWYGPVVPTGTQFRGQGLDLRGTGQSALVRQSQLLLINDSTAVGLPATAAILGLAAQRLTIPIVIPPGGGVSIVAFTANTSLTSTSVMWRERRINPSELL